VVSVAFAAIGLLSSREMSRYDRLAANYLAFVQLASIRLWLRRVRVLVAPARNLSANFAER